MRRPGRRGRAVRPAVDPPIDGAHRLAEADDLVHAGEAPLVPQVDERPQRARQELVLRVVLGGGHLALDVRLAEVDPLLLDRVRERGDRLDRLEPRPGVLALAGDLERAADRERAEVVRDLRAVLARDGADRRRAGHHRSAVRKTGNDCACGKYFGVAGKHIGRHRASRR